ncbi:MAG: hypothetical protein HQK75_05485 [Candidatus Magnetomorum sp.]|nr:hypothetical protein [Candidatus Magnetomorum sp.]
MNSKKGDHAANLLFNLLDNFPLEGNEASVKFSWKAFLNIRFLIGIRTDTISIHLENICSQLSMPKHFWDQLKKTLPESNTVLFGFEEGISQCIYKVYLEFWEKNSTTLQHISQCESPLLQYLGFKWDAFDRRKHVITKYYCYPFLSIHSMLKNLETIYRNTKDKTALNIAKALLRLSATRMTIKNPLMYLDVTDDDGMRNSFDINLYNAGLKILDIQPFLIEIQKYFEIEGQSCLSFLSQIKGKTLGHLSGGFDRQGNEFLTVYYDI